ncbi:nuclear transport factor 2 family protein [Kitasatospora sp. NPDC091207]|uniref:nuclear transport factor 2 family protein n=1 Tax=Kitasatospora sp. NPDC091207 TaxID=3364083 RepID=UPI0038032F92
MTDNTVAGAAVGEGKVAAFFDACARDAFDEAVACFAEGGVWSVAEGPEPGTSYRRDEIRAYLVDLVKKREEFGDQGIALVFEPAVVAGDRQIIEFTLRDATGRVLDRGVDLFTLKDGLILVKDVFRKA